MLQILGNAVDGHLKYLTMIVFWSGHLLECANGCWKPRDEVFVARLCNCSDLILDVKMCDVSSLACTAWHGRLNDLSWNFLAEIRDAEIH